MWRAVKTRRYIHYTYIFTGKFNLESLTVYVNIGSFSLSVGYQLWHRVIIIFWRVEIASVEAYIDDGEVEELKPELVGIVGVGVLGGADVTEGFLHIVYPQVHGQVPRYRLLPFALEGQVSSHRDDGLVIWGFHPRRIILSWYDKPWKQWIQILLMEITIM